MKSLPSNIIAKSVGVELKNMKGAVVGKIRDIIRSDKTRQIYYIILQSNIFFGERERFFAIPASPKLFALDDHKHITLTMSKEDLIFAKGTCTPKFPKPNLEVGFPVFEIFSYNQSTE